MYDKHITIIYTLIFVNFILLGFVAYTLISGPTSFVSDGADNGSNNALFDSGITV